MLQRGTRFVIRLNAGLLDDGLAFSLRLCLEPPACFFRSPYGLSRHPGLCFFLPALALESVRFLECFHLIAEIIAFAPKVLKPGGLRREACLHLQLHTVPVRLMGGTFFGQTLFGTGKKFLPELIQLLLFVCCPDLVCFGALCFESLHFGRETVLHLLLQPLPGGFCLFLHIAQSLVEVFLEAVLQLLLKRATRFCRSNLRLLAQLFLTRELLLEPD
ncbi:MAG: hypothetical protein H6Q31_2172, partial [Bacteroidetes bacterium]|nr:hypothetical protein [Bacteroidota bacterium]